MDSSFFYGYKFHSVIILGNSSKYNCRVYLVVPDSHDRPNALGTW